MIGQAVLTKLKQAWKHWSFRAAVFAAVLNGLLVLLALYQYAFTPITYAAINVIISIAIAYLRIIPQKNL